MSEVLAVREGTATYAKAAARVVDLVRDGNVERFVENFDVLVDVAGSTKRLKELVLHLAVTGRLSSGAPGTADSLVTQLRRDRLKLSSVGIRLGDDSPAVSDDEIPYDVPQGWRWIRLRDLGGFLGGGTPSKSNPAFWKGALPWVSPKDMKRPYIDDAEDHISPSAVESSAAKIIPSKSVLYVLRGMILAHSFPVAVTTREVTINQDMKALVLAIPEMAEFILRTCQAARTRVLARVQRSSHGTCRLEAEAVEMLPIALPPMAEQKRIVAKVDQLMALCDELEARQTNKREVGARLTKSALEALTSAEGPEEFDAAWARVSENFDVLLEHPEGVPPLRRALLDLVADGQLGGDMAPVSDSVPDLVWSERAHLVRQGVFRERHVQLPDRTRGWQLVPLELLLAGPLANGRSVPDGDGFPVLRLSALRGRFVNFDEAKNGAWSAHDARQFVAENGDLLVVRGNGAIRLVGRACIVGDAPQPTAFPDTAIRVRPNPKLVDTSWLWYCWETSKTREQIERRAKTTAGIFKVSQDDLSSLLMPVPPLHVQEELVRMLDRFFKQCDELEAGFRMVEERAKIVSLVLSVSLAS